MTGVAARPQDADIGKVAQTVILLIDVGNTHTHVGLATRRRLLRCAVWPTADWHHPRAIRRLRAFIGDAPIAGTIAASVVPAVNAPLRRLIRELSGHTPLMLDHRTVRGVGVRYPHPETIGADRLANAVAAHHRFGAPVVAVDFGTATTFDVVDARGDYVGGIIGPGMGLMTTALHEHTALLPRIQLRSVRRCIGRSTEEAMCIGALHGYRCLVGGLLEQLRNELAAPNLPVVLTGGDARLIARGLDGVRAVVPHLTLEGLRLVWLAHQAASDRNRHGRQTAS